MLRILEEKGEMRLDDISACFPELDYHTVAWYLNRAVKRGHVVKVARASYSISKSDAAMEPGDGCLSETASHAVDLLVENGYPFFISGLDCYPKGRFSFSGEFPTIICTPKEFTSEIQMLLMRELDIAMRSEDIGNMSQFYGSEVKYYILPCDVERFSHNGFAYQEKAICDLYFCISRMGYPLDMSELVRILSLTDINRSRFLASTKEDHIQEELNFITGYRPDFLLPFAEYVKSRNK